MRRSLRALTRACAAVVLAAAGLSAVAAPAHADDYWPTPSLNNYLMRPATNQAALQDTVKQLDTQLPKLGVQNILAQAPHTGSTANGSACNKDAVDGLAYQLTFSFCWNGADNAASGNYEWTPQGISTVADAQDDKYWGSAQPFVTTWYQQQHGTAVGEKCKYKKDGAWAEQNCVKGVRISIVDPDTGKYAHVLLVYPFVNASGNASYMSLRTKQDVSHGSLHAGGIAWYGNYLYVADTARGLRVFDMRYIFDLKEAGDKADLTDTTKIGRQDGKFYSHGYRYVMPEVAAYTNSVPRSTTQTYQCLNGSSPNTSFVSLDRTGNDHLITGEFCRLDRGDTNGRVATWPLNGDTGQPALNATCTSLSVACWRADSAYTMPIDNVQGATRHDGKWFLNQSHGEAAGVLAPQDQPDGTTGVLKPLVPTYHTPIGPEDLSYWPGSDANRSGLWSLSEHYGKRMVYVVDIP
ncbi:hypothetical protein [Actinomadura chokoriensis]|uniref:Secreted protein n=1 Tax=Actinomadura chokoriensis TaxID=454156 RepID=A0ABV4QT72_9ACTN